MPDVLITPSSGNIRFSQNINDNAASVALSGNSLVLSSTSGNISISSSSGLLINGVAVSTSVHTHTSSNITDFNTSVSGLINGIYAPLNSPTFTDTVTLTSANAFVGTRMRSNLDGQGGGFVSSVNHNGIEDSNITFFRNGDGSTSMIFANTEAGSKTVDRRHTQLVLSSNGFWDCTVAGAVASGVKPACFCRGWIVFNGTSTPSIIGAINFSSITDNGVGDYTLNLALSMPDTLYSIIGSANWDGQSRAAVVGQNSQRTKTTTAVPIVVMQGATNTLFDTSNISVAIFR
jgi:hypothetical protein